MKRLKYWLLITILLFSFNVKAADKCEKEEFNRLKELASKVEFDYDYKIVDNQAVFSIKAINLNSNLKVLIINDYYSNKYREFKDNSAHATVLDGFLSGEKVVVTIKGFVPNWCSGKTITTKTIKLPYYNFFYSEEKCRGNEDFKYCKLLLDSNVSESTFNAQFNAYLKTKNTNEQQEVVPVKNTWQLLIIIGSIVVALAIIVGIALIIVKKRRKNSL